MATQVELGPEATTREELAPPERKKSGSKSSSVMQPWLRAQSINVTRHAAGLRPFRPDEFGTGAEAPTAGHIQSVNKLVTGLRRGLLEVTAKVRKTAVATSQEPTTPRLQQLVRQKAQAHHWVRGIEKIWNFYFELFGQRQTRYAKWLLSCDRIGLD